MKKKKFEEMIPKVKLIIKMVPEVRGESSGKVVSGHNIDLEELLDPDTPRANFYKYLSNLKLEELKIVQSFMLTGRYILDGVDNYDKDTLKEIFGENYERPSHQNDKGMMASYISEKSLQLDRYLNKGLEAFYKIND